MKEYFLIYKEKFNKYYYLPNNIKTTLYQLYRFITNDYHTWDTELLTEPRRALNITYVINDLKNKIAYIGVHYDDPDHEFFQNDEEYFNETNSCKITHDNFKEFSNKWVQLKKELPPFALIYRGNLDWIDCKGFDTQKEMEAFVKDFKDEVVH